MLSIFSYVFWPSICLLWRHVYLDLLPIGGFPGGSSGKEPICQCRRHKRHGFNPWFGKIPWRRAWQPTPVFLPGESHGQKILLQCQKDLGIPPSTHLEARFPCHNSRAMPCSPRNSNGDSASLGPHARLPEFPVITREKPHTSRCSSKKTPRDCPLIAR